MTAAIALALFATAPAFAAPPTDPVGAFEGVLDVRVDSNFGTCVGTADLVLASARTPLVGIVPYWEDDGVFSAALDVDVEAGCVDEWWVADALGVGPNGRSWLVLGGPGSWDAGWHLREWPPRAHIPEDYVIWEADVGAYGDGSAVDVRLVRDALDMGAGTWSVATFTAPSRT